MSYQHEFTQLLSKASGGDKEAERQLEPILLASLREIAHRQRRKERMGLTLETGDLVSEAWLRLFDQTEALWQNQAHFLHAAARTIHHILIDYARRKQADKRKGQRVTLEEDADIPDEVVSEWLNVEEALGRLEQYNARWASVVRMRYFSGFTIEQIAQALEVAPKTVQRDWNHARGWLLRDLSEDMPGSPA
jgi:RNA polymerase sigma factor (TIGR02999 family)